MFRFVFRRFVLVLLTGLMACTVDLDSRCITNMDCPAESYCNGGWCFAGAPDAQTVDRGFDDAATDGGPPLDMQTDTVRDMESDRSLSGVVGNASPPNGFVGAAIPGRDAIGVQITETDMASFALVDVGAPCSEFQANALVDGQLVIVASDWENFAPLGTFELCVQAGPTDARFGPYMVDETAPSLAGFDTQDGTVFIASEPIEMAFLGDSGCGVSQPLRVDDEPTRLVYDMPLPAGEYGLQLSDLAGNTICRELTVSDAGCALDAALDLDTNTSPESQLLQTNCPDLIRLNQGRLVGTCGDCQALIRDGEDYQLMRVVARRPQFATPLVVSTQPGLPGEGTLNDVGLLGQGVLGAMSDSTLQRWSEVVSGIWRPGLFRNDFASKKLVPIESGDGLTALIETISAQDPVFQLIDADLQAVAPPLVLGSPVEQAFSLVSDNAQELVLLSRGLVTTRSSRNWMVEGRLGNNITHIARLKARDVVTVSVDNALVVFENRANLDFLERSAGELPGVANALTTGDWTNDGEADIALAIGDDIQVVPVIRRPAGMQFGQPINIRLNGPTLTDIVMGDADADGRADLLVRHADGRLRLIINAPGMPQHILDPPHPAGRIKALNAPDSALDLILFHPLNRSASRWQAVAELPVAEQITVDVPPDHVVVGVGDVDGDQQVECVLRDTASQKLHIPHLDGRDGEDLSLLGNPAINSSAAALGDLNGDGWPDVVSWTIARDEPQLSWWLAQSAQQSPRVHFPIAENTGEVDELVTGDWLGNGRADVVVRDAQVLRPFFNDIAPNVEVAFSPGPAKVFGGLLGFAIADILADANGRLELYVARERTQHAFSAATYRAFANRNEGGPALGLARTVVAPIQGVSRLFLVFAGNADGPGRVETGEQTIYEGAVRDCAVGDLDHDGQHEVLLLVDPDAPKLVRLKQRGEEYVQFAPPEPVPAKTTGVRLGDVNGDGRLDVILLARP